MKHLTLIIYSFLAAAALFAQTPAEDLVKANGHYRQARLDAAEFFYRKVLEAEPANAIAQYNLGCLLYKKGKNETEALELMQQVSKSATDKNLRAKAFYNEGVMHSKKKSLPESIESYKNALRINPDDTQARENLQKALLELKQQQSKSRDQKKKPDPKMSQKEAEQKLKQLQQKERDLQKRMQSKNTGTGQSQDW